MDSTMERVARILSLVQALWPGPGEYVFRHVGMELLCVIEFSGAIP